MKSSVRSLRPFFGDVFYSPRERRRIARSGSAPGRRFAVPVPLRRPGPGTLAGLIDLLLFACPGLRRRDLRARTVPLARVRIEVPAQHVDDARRAIMAEMQIRAYIPAGVTVELFGDDSPLRVPVTWSAPAERIPAIMPWTTEPPFELCAARLGKMHVVDTRATSVFMPWSADSPFAPPPPIVELECRVYASELLGWRDGVFATREDHESGRVVEILRGGEAVVALLATLAALAPRCA